MRIKKYQFKIAWSLRLAVNLFVVLFILKAYGHVRAQVNPDSVKRVTAIRDIYPYWSPDGKQIVFQSDRNSGIREHFQIYIINTDGSNLRRITNRPEFSDETPVWSPDGIKILFSSYITDDNNELFIMNTDGSDLKQLTHNPTSDGHQKFSPDGKKIIFCSKRDDEGINPDLNYEIYEMNIDGTDIRRLTNYVGWDTYPSISPNGSKILWRRILETGGNSRSGRNSEIFLMNRDGTNPNNLTNHPDFDGYPCWSPDGSKIVFASNRGNKNRDNFHLYIMNADGTGVIKVLENDNNVIPCSNPKSRYLFLIPVR